MKIPLFCSSHSRNMNSRLVVDEKEGLKESREVNFSSQPRGIRWAAIVISYLFHPVFVPVYLVLFMVYIHPYLFVGLSSFDKARVVIMAIVTYSFFPVVTVLLLRGLKFIQGIQLKTQRDRIIPLVACGVWYFWICYVWWNSSKMDDSLPIPKEAVKLALAIFIASWLGLMLNIKMKVSLHTLSMGVATAFILFLAFSGQLNFGIYIAITLLTAGLVASSRFIVSDHRSAEIYGGLIAGVAAQVVAWWAVNAFW